MLRTCGLFTVPVPGVLTLPVVGARLWGPVCGLPSLGSPSVGFPSVESRLWGPVCRAHLWVPVSGVLTEPVCGVLTVPWWQMLINPSVKSPGGENLGSLGLYSLTLQVSSSSPFKPLLLALTVCLNASTPSPSKFYSLSRAPLFPLPLPREKLLPLPQDSYSLFLFLKRSSSLSHIPILPLRFLERSTVPYSLCYGAVYSLSYTLPYLMQSTPSPTHCPT